MSWNNIEREHQAQVEKLERRVSELEAELHLASLEHDMTRRTLQAVECDLGKRIAELEEAMKAIEERSRWALAGDRCTNTTTEIPPNSV